MIQMKAAVVHAPGGPEALKLEMRPIPDHFAIRSFSGDTLNCKRPDFMPLIGYARVSTDDQTPLP